VSHRARASAIVSYTLICSYETVLKRWPVILTGIIDRLHRINHELTVKVRKGDPVSKTVLEEKIEEGKQIIAGISGLKYRMGRDKKLE
jgi:damage-control phosphatase, subfamily III